jgi:hypothetical protein
MAREIYFKDVKFSAYSLWHRSLTEKLGMLDIDACGICLKCKFPLYLAETAFDVGQPWKATTTTKKLAELAGLPSFLVFYKVDGSSITSFRIKQLTPYKSEEMFMMPDGWLQVMQLLQERHDLICEGKR